MGEGGGRGEGSNVPVGDEGGGRGGEGSNVPVGDGGGGKDPMFQWEMRVGEGGGGGREIQCSSGR